MPKTAPPNPILVVSTNDDTRNLLMESLAPFSVNSVACSSFVEAEMLALSGLYSGILLDLPSIVKAKGEEKIVACSLTAFFPTLRVRVMGNMLIPMTMPGTARQESSLQDFIERACSSFATRPLRQHSRHPNGVSLSIRFKGTETRAFSLNISWSGAFVVDFNPERFVIGDQVELYFQEPQATVTATISWKQSWGLRHAPGIGVCFHALDKKMSDFLLLLLKRAKNHDPDRLVA